MLRNLIIGVSGILFLSGFFFLDGDDANPYKEETETIDEAAFIEIKLNHRAAEFAVEKAEKTWMEFHFERRVSEEELLLFSTINTEEEPIVAEENGIEVTLNWQGVEVDYKKDENYWKIDRVKEASIKDDK